MGLQKTNLLIVAAPIPPDFKGTPAEFQEAMVKRMAIVSPVGTNFFVVSDVEPSSNVGPWLKGGTQWWVFNIDTGRYEPLDISASAIPFAQVGPDEPSEPEGDEPLIWFRTAQDRIAGIYAWTGSQWRAQGSINNSGPTTERPTAPADLEQFFDTDINVQLRFERGAWRTAAGSPGDIKAVTHTTLTEALRHNPGWSLLGSSDQSIRGRLIGQAAKDPGDNPASAFTTDSGITVRFAGEKAGAENVLLTDVQIPQHTHLIGHATALHNDNNILIYRVDNDQDVSIPPIVPPNHFRVDGEAGTDGTKTGTAGDGPTGTPLVTSRQLGKAAYPPYFGDAQEHTNLPQSLFYWHLVKE